MQRERQNNCLQGEGGGEGGLQNCAVSMNSHKNVTDVCKLVVCLLLLFYLKLILNFLKRIKSNLGLDSEFQPSPFKVFWVYSRYILSHIPGQES